MLRTALIAAIATLSVIPATTAIAHDDKTAYVTNNTTYDFTGGYVQNKKNVTITGMPVTIKAGQGVSFEIDIKKKSDFTADLHWLINDEVGTSVAIKYKSTSSGIQCHTDVPEGIHSDHYDCNSDHPKWYFCDASSESDCDK
ncbi:MAG: hypothetical protein AAFN16_03975 [Pseudomonadota bacterium]